MYGICQECHFKSDEFNYYYNICPRCGNIVNLYEENDFDELEDRMVF